MIKTSLRTTLAQINTTVGDFSGNLKKIEGVFFEARKAQAQLVIFPELTTTGYPPEDLLFRNSFIEQNLKTLQKAALLSKNLSAVVGFVDRDKDGRLYNAAAILSNGKIKNIYRKRELPNYGVFDEKRYFTPGEKSISLKIENFSVGITICEDIWESESFVYKKAFFKPLDLIVNISASPYHYGKQAERCKLLRNLAIKTNSCVAYLNLVGGQDELVFDGGSSVLNPRGSVVAEAKRFCEDILTVDIPLSKNKPLPMPNKPLRKNNEEAEVCEALVLGTRDYINKNGFKKILIGLSGGIDSALVAKIAVDAVGRENVLGVTMPSPYTSKETYRDAKELAKNLEISCIEFRIDDIYRRYLDLLKKSFGNAPSGLAEENLQARIRGNIMMALSNKWGHLVLTTGNKSEIATGYCTLYGDMAGGFAVIKDVPKTLVFKLCRFLNQQTTKEIIPPSIIKRPPTAELKFNQKDQDTLPPYAVLDKIIEAYVEQDLSSEEIAKKGPSIALVKKVAQMIDKSEYKRRQGPPGIKITPKAFGRDRRMPLTNRFAS